MDFKPIETRYKGYRMRSRLEARWAVFFDSLGVEWQYETEGFTLPDGTRYLPDFWLPAVGASCFVEIKPGEMNEAEDNKAKQLAMGSGKHVMCFCGNPWPGEFRVWQFRRKTAVPPLLGELLDRCIAEQSAWLFHRVAHPSYDVHEYVERMREAIKQPGFRLAEDAESRVSVCERSLSYCDQHRAMSFGLMMEGLRQCKTCGEVFDTKQRTPQAWCFARDFDDENEWCTPSVDCQSILDAFAAARGARFEHGENGGARA